MMGQRAGEGEVIVRLDGVSKSYRSNGSECQVLRSVSFAVSLGEQVSLIGASGSGKSTLFSVIAGLLSPEVGTVEIDGRTVGSLNERARAQMRADRIGIALQADNLIPFLSAAENVELAMAFVPPGVHQPTPQEVSERSAALLDRFGVAHRATHRPRHLSGGEAQRVALAVAMANDPALLLADEIASGLDAETAGSVFEDLMASDVAMLFVTHDLALADLAPRRLALENGQVHPR